jgi:hypothetical protein
LEVGSVLPARVPEGVDVLQAALARDRLREFQAQAAIAALHADARTAEETGWVQIVEWCDELLRLTDSPVARLNRAVAVGEADGSRPAWSPRPSSTPPCPARSRWGGAVPCSTGSFVDGRSRLAITLDREDVPVGILEPGDSAAASTG